MPSPYIEYHIDFDEDKILEPAEEVSSDLKAFMLTRGKDLQANRAPAASLNVTMHNHDGKYTPINSGSPLHPFQLPGPDVRLRMAYPYDSFTDSNGTALHGRALPKADLQTVAEPDWAAWQDTGGDFEIRSNHLELTTRLYDRCAVLDFGTANARIGADIILDDSTSYPFHQGLLVFRYYDQDNYNAIMVYHEDADDWGVRVYTVTSGTATSVAPDSAYNLKTHIWDKGDSARVEAQFTDNEVIVWVNDYAVAEFSNVEPNLTRTKHGVGGYYFSANAVTGAAGSRKVQWDNFGGWNTVFSGRTDTVEPLPGKDASANIAAWDDFERLNRHPIFRTATAPQTAKQLIDTVLVAGNVPGDRPLLNGATPATDLLTIADTGQTLLKDFNKAMGLSGLGELYQIQDDEVGFIWIDGRGTYRFEASDHRDSAPHDTYLATWEDTSVESAPSIAMEPAPRWYDGKDVVENEVFYRFNRAAKALGATVWVLEIDDNPNFQVPPAINNGKGWLQLDIVALDPDNVVGNIRNPIPGTDYTIFQNANGTGLNWLTPMASESGTVSITESTGVLQIDDTGAPFGGNTTIGAGSFPDDGRIIVVRDDSGNTAVGYVPSIDVDGDDTRRNITDWPEDYNGAGAYGSPGWIRADDGFDKTDTPLTFDTLLSGAYIIDGFEGEMALIRYLTTDTYEDSNFLTSAILKADETVASNPTAARAANTSSQETFGRRRVDHTTKYIDTWAMAQGRADARLAARKDERERFVVTLKNLDKYNLMEMLYRDVSDRIRLNLTEMGMANRNYWIESYVMTVTEGGKNISMTFTLSKVV